MRKRFISGLTAVFMLCILLANSFLAVPASAVIAEAAASVAAGLLMGTLFNQMTGGTGYDFTDAFADCFGFVVTPHNQFIRDNPDADIYLPDGTPYYVDGQYAAAIELKKGEAEITKMVQSHWNIAESLGLKTPQEAIHSALEVLNKGLADGSIVIHVDDDGNISMPTTSWCNAVSETYDKFGIYKNKNGLNYVQTYFSIVSEYIESTWRGWDQTVCCTDLRPHSSFKPNFVPYFVQNDKLTFLNLRYVVGVHSVSLQYLSWSSGKIDSGVSTPALKIDSELYSQKDGSYVEGLSCTQSFSLTTDLTLASMSAVNAVDSVSYDYDLSNNRSFRVGLGGTEFDPSSPVQECGYVLLKDGSSAFSGFKIAATEGAIENKRNDVSIPLTGVENTIGNMGLAGVGSGTAKGTVNVDAKTKDITVTNEQTKEAEKVIEQGNAGDIDTPDVDSITDKFPFSLPFDIYNLVTIFVRDEQKPIFEIPIQTTLDIAGEDYKVDEKIVLDLTQFQLNGVDIIRVFTRTVTYVAFIAFLIKITPHVIKH